MTGAVLPQGADAVCMVERTRSADDGATLRDTRPAGCVRRRARGRK